MPSKVPMPVVDLLDIIRPSVAPCVEIRGRCAGHVRYEPAAGFLPRSWIGGYGEVDGIRLVIVTAEPGDPATGEAYPEGDPEETLRSYNAFVRHVLSTGSLRHRNGRRPPFHGNLRRILDLFWPGFTLDEQLERTWIMPSVLCSARVSGGSVPRVVEDACAERYVSKMLATLPNAFVVALGGKAADRLRRTGRSADAEAQHPSARPNTNPVASWEAAAKLFLEGR